MCFVHIYLPKNRQTYVVRVKQRFVHFKFTDGLIKACDIMKSVNAIGIFMETLCDGS